MSITSISDDGHSADRAMTTRVTSELSAKPAISNCIRKRRKVNSNGAPCEAKVSCTVRRGAWANTPAGNSGRCGLCLPLHLWRNIKRHNTHNRYFPAFSDLTTAVETALSHFQQHPQAVKQLMGSYLDEAVALVAAA